MYCVMNIREEKESKEKLILSEYASFSVKSKGRKLYEEECPVRTCFERDRDRIVYSKAFRRLKHKTQVFISPDSDHLRTRLTHTLEVSQIARSISCALGLNENLTEAIALGHDLGHTPFGHAGEAALNELYENGFEHNLQSLRIVDELEGGCGLNLTYEVRDGIKNHCSRYIPSTLEGKVVNISDKIAYINHDMDDAVVMGVLKEDDFPLRLIKVLGKNNSERINTMIIDVIQNSKGKNDIIKNDEIKQATDELRAFLFDTLYTSEFARRENEKAKDIVRSLYEYYLKNPLKMPDVYVKRGEEDMARSVCDYIAGMTDNYAVNVYEEIMLPKSWA